MLIFSIIELELYDYQILVAIVEFNVYLLIKNCFCKYEYSTLIVFCKLYFWWEVVILTPSGLVYFGGTDRFFKDI